MVALDTEEEVQVDDECDMFMVRYEVNRVTVIDDPKNREKGLYATVGHVNRAVRLLNRNDGQSAAVGSVEKQKKVMEALTLYKWKKDKILLANQPHMGGLKPGGDEDWKIKLVGNCKESAFPVHSLISLVMFIAISSYWELGYRGLRSF